MKKEDPYRVQAQLQKQRLKKVTSEEEVPVTEERQDSSSHQEVLFTRIRRKN
ncbi:hypothetical protein AAHB53_26055 [Niallia circulans]